MLLELRQLSQSLRSANVTVEERDDHLVGYSKAKPVFRVDLGVLGDVRGVSLLDRNQVDVLLTYQIDTGAGRGVSMPGFNAPYLFRAKEAEEKVVFGAVKKVAKRLGLGTKGDDSEGPRATLADIMSRCDPGWEVQGRKIGKCLTQAVDTVISHLSKAEERDRVAVDPLRELLRRAGRLSPESLRNQLVGACCNILLGGTVSDQVEAVLKWMFTTDGVVLLELADWTGTLANDPSVWQAFNRVLFAGRGDARSAPQAADTSAEDTTDAFGLSYRPSGTKMPERKVPRLGNVKLRSNSDRKPCQARYGLVEGESFPVGPALASSLADSLAWLTADEREGKTYRDISGASGMLKREGGKPKPRETLLLAYPDPCPQEPPELAGLFASMPAGEDFASVAGLTVKQLDDLTPRTQPTTVNVFVLYRRDKGRVKLLFSRQFSTDRITQAVYDWQVAAANTPPIVVPLPDRGKDLAWRRCGVTPFPSEVVRCLNQVWQRGGERADKVVAFNFGSGLALFLDDGPLVTELAGRALRLAVEHWTDLLLAMGQALSLGHVFPQSDNEQPLLPPILGLLLAKLGHSKEVYMTALPYWLGRLLAAADKLHRNYCDRERNGQIPAGPLLGNASMAACLENPQAGLAELAHRIPPYQRVAGEQLSAEVAEIVRHIDPDQLPKRTTDEDKAQMLLGYLARPDLLPPEPPPENRS